MKNNIKNILFLHFIAAFLIFSCSLELSESSENRFPEVNTNFSETEKNRATESNEDGKIKISLSSRVYGYPPESSFSAYTIITSMIKGNTYYLDAINGDDIKGDGSEEYPWKNLNFVQSKTLPGDGVILKAGNYGDFVYQDRGVTPNEYVIYLAREKNTVFFDSIQLDKALSQPFILFYNISVREKSPEEKPGERREIFCYHDFPLISTDNEIEYIILTEAKKEVPLVYTRDEGVSYDFEEYDLSELKKKGSGESFFLKIKTADRIEAETLKVTFINNDEYSMFIRYETFKELHNSLYTSEKFLKKAKIKDFVGNVTLEL